MSCRIDPEESRRLDALKVLMCVFVLLVHAYSDDYSATGIMGVGCQGIYILSRIICDCAVPVFMLISSVLLYAKPIRWGTHLKKKCKSLLIPYLILNTLWIAVLLGAGLLGVKMGTDDPASYNWFDWLDAYLGLAGDYKPVLSTLWYLRDLLLLELLAIPIKKLVEKLPVPMLVLVLAYWASGLELPGVRPYSVVPFVLGCWLVQKDLHFSDLDRKLSLPIKGGAYALLLVAAILFPLEAVKRLFVAASVLLWIRLSVKLIRFEKIIGLLLPVTFFLFLGHRFVYLPFQVIASGSVGRYLLTYGLKPLAALSILTGVYYLMARCMPGFLSVLIGGRLKKSPKPSHNGMDR